MQYFIQQAVVLKNKKLSDFLHYCLCLFLRKGVFDVLAKRPKFITYRIDCVRYTFTRICHDENTCNYKQAIGEYDVIVLLSDEHVVIV